MTFSKEKQKAGLYSKTYVYFAFSKTLNIVLILSYFYLFSLFILLVIFGKKIVLKCLQQTLGYLWTKKLNLKIVSKF